MNRRRTGFTIAAAAALVFALIQFVPVERTNPPVESELNAPAEVMAVLRRACYDCHSNTTEWPWYSHVAPVSWLVAGHVREARADLNFSEWPVFNLDVLEGALEDIEREVSKGAMPLRSYTLVHPSARLSARDRDILTEWARASKPNG